MFDLDRYFDRRTGNVLMQDPEKLDLEASWLFRETADGWTLARRLERVRADLELLLRGWIPTDEVQAAAAAILADWRIVLAGNSLALEGTVSGHPVIGEARRVQTADARCSPHRGV